MTWRAAGPRRRRSTSPTAAFSIASISRASNALVGKDSGNRMNILLLAGSPSLSSRSTRLLHHVGEKLALLGHRDAKLNVRDLPALALLQADFGDETLKAARAQVADADAVVIATPVYKAAYSGILKAFLDLRPQDGLKGKLVLPLATGGSQSHMLALDYGLRP